MPLAQKPKLKDRIREQLKICQEKLPKPEVKKA